MVAVLLKIFDKAFAVGIISYHHATILYYTHHGMLAPESFMSIHIGRIPFAEGLFPGCNDAIHRFTQILKRFFDLVCVCTLRLLYCGSKYQSRVVALGSRNRRENSGHAVSL